MYPKGRKYCTVWVQAPGTIPSNGLVFIVFLNKDALPEFIEGKNNEQCRKQFQPKQLFQIFQQPENTNGIWSPTPQFGENGAGFDRPSEQNTKFRMRQILSFNTVIQLFNPIRCSGVDQSWKIWIKPLPELDKEYRDIISRGQNFKDPLIGPENYNFFHTHPQL